MDWRKNKINSSYKDAELSMVIKLLKVFDMRVFETHFVVHRYCYDVLNFLYSTREFGKRRFLFQRRKKCFEDKFINKAVKTLIDAAGSEDFITAYGDGSFPLVMKGLDGSGLAHKRLMMLLSKRTRNVMTNECQTTKACP